MITIKKDSNFIKHFLVIGGGTLLNMTLGFITTPLITRLVDPEEYGRLSIFTMYSNIAVMILCLGLDQALVRYYYDNKDLLYKRGLLFKCIILPIVISVILSIAVILTSIYNIINYEFSTFIIIMLCLYTVVQIIYRFSLLVVRLEYNSSLYSALNIMIKLFYVILAIPLLITISNNNSLEILVVSNVVAASLCLIISIIVQANLWNFFERDKKNVNIKELVKYAYPYIISMGVTTLFQAIDKISLNYFCDYKEVGIYASTLTLVNIFAIIQTTFNALWSPMAVEHYTNQPNDKNFYKKVSSVITVIMFFVGISLIFVKDIFAFLLGEKYREAAYILPFLIFNPIMYTISETTGIGLVLKKKSGMQVIVAVLACATNIIGNLLLVPTFGCKGAAISTGISYIIFFTTKTIISNKYYYINHNLTNFYIITFLTILYAFFNTFNTFSILCILFYIVLISILIILYIDTFKEIINYSLNQIKKICRGGLKHD